MNDFLKMQKKATNRSMPPGTIIPELVYEDLETAVPWLCDTFGFQERLRIGNHRSQLRLGEASVIAIANSSGHTSPDSGSTDVTHSIMVRVEDVDRHYQHVKRRGASLINPPTDYPYGERQYTMSDIGGHVWTFSQSIDDVDPVEWGGKLMDSTDEKV